MVDPDRIIIDVPEVNFQIDPAIGRAPQGRSLGQIVKSFRFGLLGAGKSRIVIDLAAPARVTRVATQAIVNGAEAARLQIDLSRCEPAAFQQAAKEGEQDAGPGRGRAGAGEFVADRLGADDDRSGSRSWRGRQRGDRPRRRRRENNRL